jgi:hypothetical protein
MCNTYAGWCIQLLQTSVFLELLLEVNIMYLDIFFGKLGLNEYKKA